jgi:protein-S-isoprenylcysteine O-methyltransferase Ste14
MADEPGRRCARHHCRIVTVFAGAIDLQRESDGARHEMAMTGNPWWRGKKGEWYLPLQAALFILVTVGPRTLPGLPAWSAGWSRFGTVGGGLLFLAGALLAVAGAVSLGRNLTPLPRPKEDAILVVTGAYRLVRHPIYSGITAMAFGWGLWVDGWLTLGYALLLFVFFDRKSRREERWLAEKFPEYAAYRQKVRRLVPFLY